MSLKPRWPGSTAGTSIGEVISAAPVDPGPRVRPRRTPRVMMPSGTRASGADAVRRGTAVLMAATPQMDLRDPMLPAALRFTSSHGAASFAAPILGAWRNRTLASISRERETPWTLGVDASPNSPAYDTFDATGALWRPRERDWLDRDPTEFGHRLVGPIALAENADFLARLERDPNPTIARTAGEILREAQPRIEADLATFIAGSDPWRDTFALWLLVRREAALVLLNPLAVAIATRYGTLASRLAGLVCGSRSPFEGVPLTSANAHLGVALWTLDYRPSLMGGIVAFVRSRQTADGGFADEGQFADVLTTLAAADLLSTIDPTFDPSPTALWLARTQEPSGWWRALDPEVPWLTAAVVEWLESAERPFAERFRWPAYQRTDLDRKTGIPGYAAFDRLARVFDAVPGIAAAPLELAFGDLAGFREYNNRHGQEMGDRVLQAFAAGLAGIGASLAIRDGGDEFLVVGAPNRPDLVADLDRFRAAWPARFTAEFGAAAGFVAPRFVVIGSRGGELRAARETLGRAIGRVKVEVAEPPPEGTLRRVEG